LRRAIQFITSPYFLLLALCLSGKIIPIFKTSRTGLVFKPTANMSSEVIDRPNPQALPSHILDEVLNLSVKLEKIQLSDSDLKGLEEFRRRRSRKVLSSILYE